jgi:hypothetical protein
MVGLEPTVSGFQGRRIAKLSHILKPRPTKKARVK